MTVRSTSSLEFVFPPPPASPERGAATHSDEAEVRRLKLEADGEELARVDGVTSRGVLIEALADGPKSLAQMIAAFFSRGLEWKYEASEQLELMIACGEIVQEGMLFGLQSLRSTESADVPAATVPAADDTLGTLPHRRPVTPASEAGRERKRRNVEEKAAATFARNAMAAPPRMPKDVEVFALFADPPQSGSTSFRCVALLAAMHEDESFPVFSAAALAFGLRSASSHIEQVLESDVQVRLKPGVQLQRCADGYSLCLDDEALALLRSRRERFGTSLDSEALTRAEEFTLHESQGVQRIDEEPARAKAIRGPLPSFEEVCSLVERKLTRGDAADQFMSRLAARIDDEFPCYTPETLGRELGKQAAAIRKTKEHVTNRLKPGVRWSARQSLQLEVDESILVVLTELRELYGTRPEPAAPQPARVTMGRNPRRLLLALGDGEEHEGEVLRAGLKWSAKTLGNAYSSLRRIFGGKVESYSKFYRLDVAAPQVIEALEWARSKEEEQARASAFRADPVPSVVAENVEAENVEAENVHPDGGAQQARAAWLHLLASGPKTTAEMDAVLIALSVPWTPEVNQQLQSMIACGEVCLMGDFWWLGHVPAVGATEPGAPLALDEAEAPADPAP